MKTFAINFQFLKDKINNSSIKHETRMINNHRITTDGFLTTYQLNTLEQNIHVEIVYVMYVRIFIVCVRVNTSLNSMVSSVSV